MEEFPDIDFNLDPNSTPWCTSCLELKQELERLKTSHTLSCKTIKEKIISTDKLIKQYTSKCSEFEELVKRYNDATKKAVTYQRDWEEISNRLQEALKEVEPLRRYKLRHEKESASREKQLEAAKSEVSAAQAHTLQLTQCVGLKDEELAKVLTEKDLIQERAVTAETHLKKCKAQLEKISKTEAPALKQVNSRLKRENASLEKQLNRLRSKLKEEDLLTEAGNLNAQKIKQLRLGITTGKKSREILETRDGFISDLETRTGEIDNEGDETVQEMSQESEDSAEEDLEQIFAHVGLFSPLTSGLSWKPPENPKLREAHFRPIVPPISPLPFSPAPPPEQQSEDESSDEDITRLVDAQLFGAKSPLRRSPRQIGAKNIKTDDTSNFGATKVKKRVSHFVKGKSALNSSKGKSTSASTSPSKSSDNKKIGTRSRTRLVNSPDSKQNANTPLVQLEKHNPDHDTATKPDSCLNKSVTEYGLSQISRSLSDSSDSEGHAEEHDVNHVPFSKSAHALSSPPENHNLKLNSKTQDVLKDTNEVVNIISNVNSDQKNLTDKVSKVDSNTETLIEKAMETSLDEEPRPKSLSENQVMDYNKTSTENERTISDKQNEANSTSLSSTNGPNSNTVPNQSGAVQINVAENISICQNDENAVLTSDKRSVCEEGKNDVLNLSQGENDENDMRRDLIKRNITDAVSVVKDNDELIQSAESENVLTSVQVNNMLESIDGSVLVKAVDNNVHTIQENESCMENSLVVKDNEDQNSVKNKQNTEIDLPHGASIEMQLPGQDERNQISTPEKMKLGKERNELQLSTKGALTSPSLSQFTIHVEDCMKTAKHDKNVHSENKESVNCGSKQDHTNTEKQFKTSQTTKNEMKTSTISSKTNSEDTTEVSHNISQGSVVAKKLSNRRRNSNRFCKQSTGSFDVTPETVISPVSMKSPIILMEQDRVTKMVVGTQNWSNTSQSKHGSKIGTGSDQVLDLDKNKNSDQDVKSTDARESEHFLDSEKESQEIAPPVEILDSETSQNKPALKDKGFQNDSTESVIKTSVESVQSNSIQKPTINIESSSRIEQHSSGISIQIAESLPFDVDANLTDTSDNKNTLCINAPDKNNYVDQSEPRLSKRRTRSSSQRLIRQNSQFVGDNEEKRSSDCEKDTLKDVRGTSIEKKLCDDKNSSAEAENMLVSVTCSLNQSDQSSILITRQRSRSRTFSTSSEITSKISSRKPAHNQDKDKPKQNKSCTELNTFDQRQDVKSSSRVTRRSKSLENVASLKRTPAKRGRCRSHIASSNQSNESTGNDDVIHNQPNESAKSNDVMHKNKSNECTENNDDIHKSQSNESAENNDVICQNKVDDEQSSTEYLQGNIENKDGQKSGDTQETLPVEQLEEEECAKPNTTVKSCIDAKENAASQGKNEQVANQENSISSLKERNDENNAYDSDSSEASSFVSDFGLENLFTALSPLPPTPKRVSPQESVTSSKDVDIAEIDDVLGIKSMHSNRENEGEIVEQMSENQILANFDKNTELEPEIGLTEKRDEIGDGDFNIYSKVTHGIFSPQKAAVNLLKSTDDKPTARSLFKDNDENIESETDKNKSTNAAISKKKKKQVDLESARKPKEENSEMVHINEPSIENENSVKLQNTCSKETSKHTEKVINAEETLISEGNNSALERNQNSSTNKNNVTKTGSEIDAENPTSRKISQTMHSSKPNAKTRPNLDKDDSKQTTEIQQENLGECELQNVFEPRVHSKRIAHKGNAETQRQALVKNALKRTVTVLDYVPETGKRSKKRSTAKSRDNVDKNDLDTNKSEGQTVQSVKMKKSAKKSKKNVDSGKMVTSRGKGKSSEQLAMDSNEIKSEPNTNHQCLTQNNANPGIDITPVEGVSVNQLTRQNSDQSASTTLQPMRIGTKRPSGDSHENTPPTKVTRFEDLECPPDLAKSIDRELQFLQRFRTMKIADIAKRLCNQNQNITAQYLIHRIIHMLSQSDKDLLQEAYNRCNEGCQQETWQPLLSDQEQRIVELIMHIHETQLLESVLDQFLKTAARCIVQSSTIHVLGKCAIVRVFCELCHLNLIPTRMRCLMYDVIYYDVIGVTSLVAACVMVWPASLARKSDKGDQVMISVFEYKLFALEEETSQSTSCKQEQIMVFLSTLCDWSIPDDTTSRDVLVQIVQTLENCDVTHPGAHERSFECEKALQLLLRGQSGEWIRSNFMYGVALPRLHVWLNGNAKSRVLLGKCLLSVIGFVCRELLSGDQSQIKFLIDTLSKYCVEDTAEQFSMDAQEMAVRSIVLLSKHHRCYAVNLCYQWLLGKKDRLTTEQKIKFKSFVTSNQEYIDNFDNGIW